MTIKYLRQILTPGQIFVAARVYGEGRSIADVAHELAPSRDHEKADAMKRHVATVAKRLQRARQRLRKHGLRLGDARRHRLTQPPTVRTFTSVGWHSH